jgi:glucose/arabinose dehydrogenase
VRDLPAAGVIRTGLLALLLASLTAPATALGQAGVSYQIPPDNPFVGQPGAAPEVYAYGLRNPYRFSFDRLTGDLLIGDVGGGLREEVDWIGPYAARGANFGWPCREGKVPGPGGPRCPAANPAEPLFDYANAGGSVVTAGYVVRDGALGGLVGRALFADFGGGAIRSLRLDSANPDDTSTGATVPSLASFGEDALGRLYAVGLGGSVVRLVPGSGPGLLATQPITGTWLQPVAAGAVPGDASRLFVAELEGRIRLVVGGQVQSGSFLDISSLVSVGGERGLLSVAAAPDYANSGRIYVYYTDDDANDVGDIRVEEFTRSATDPTQADPASRRPLLDIEHSSAGNHNGGQLQFGPDGCLWITTGDGGGQNDQFDNAQNVATLKGKILRLDPDPPGRGGPVCQLPPLPPPVAPTSTGPAADTIAPAPKPLPPAASALDRTAPRVRASIKRRQRVLRLRGAVAFARCNEFCTVAAGGTLRVGRRAFRLRRATRTVPPSRRARLKVRLTGRSARALRRALRRGRRPSVRVRLRAADPAGNRSRLVLATVRVRR